MGLVFGVGPGRCGTLALVNLLSCSQSTLALHEGFTCKPFVLTRTERMLFPLTLENVQCYWQPELATSILKEKRTKQYSLLFDQYEKTTIAEIAYYLSPFTAALAKEFPGAKLIFLTRNGADFVRSVYTDENPDPMPVGYVDRDALSPVEKFVEAGRLKMRDIDNATIIWHRYSAFQRNAWLWAETNRIVLDAKA